MHEVLRAHLEAIRDGSSPIGYEIASGDDLECWFVAHVGLQKRFHMTRGCPLGTIGNEVTENDELIRQDLSLIFEVVRSKIAKFFVKEKAGGRLKPDAREDDLADFCVAMIQGAMLLGKVKRNSGLVETTVRETMLHLRGYERGVRPAVSRRPRRISTRTRT